MASGMPPLNWVRVEGGGEMVREGREGGRFGEQPGAGDFMAGAGASVRATDLGRVL